MIKSNKIQRNVSNVEFEKQYPIRSAARLAHRRDSLLIQRMPSSRDDSSNSSRQSCKANLIEDFPSSKQLLYDVNDDFKIAPPPPPPQRQEPVKAVSLLPSTSILAVGHNSSSASAKEDQNHRVKFSRKARIRLIPEFSHEDISISWYTSEERRRLQKQAKQVAKLRRNFSADALEAEFGESSRGLEHFLTKAGFEQQQKEQSNVIDAVLLLQHHRKVRGQPYNANEIAYTSYILSTAARDRALSNGTSDALFVVEDNNQ